MKSLTICIFFITNHQPLFQICVTLPVESAPFFVPSTSFCSLSSWFTSSCAYHLITVTTFALAIYHSLDLSLQTSNSSLSQILSSIVTLIPSGLPSWILTCTELQRHCTVCFSFFFTEILCDRGLILRSSFGRC